jgi:orsellinic acid C2-O-methyltransferase
MTMRDQVLGMLNGAWMCQAIAVACELDIPDRLAAGPCDAGSLAAQTGTHAASMSRFLRALCAIEICEQRADGTFALGSAGDWLRRDRPGSLHGWALLCRHRLWSLWSDLHEGLRTGESVRRRRRGFDDYGELQRDAAMADVFNRAMTSITAPVARALVQKVSFDGVESVLDIGGGAGHLLAAVLASNPRLHGIVYDLAHARELAAETLRNERVGDRAKFVEGSFFDAVPSGGDAYLLKSVLHNWDDERAGRILERCAAAMSRESRLMILERVLPPRLSTSATDRDAARSDLQMLLGCDGRERTRAEFDALLRAAGLEARGLVPLTSDFSLIEAARA